MPVPAVDSNFWKLQRYNGLDSCATLELFDDLGGIMTDAARITYELKKEVQAPALDMMLRGMRINKAKVHEKKTKLQAEIDQIRQTIQVIVAGIGWLSPAHRKRPKEDPLINPGSDDQVKDLMYQFLGYKEQTKFDKGQRKVSVDRACMEKIAEKEGPLAAFLVRAILEYRDRVKSLGFLKTGISPDGRMRTAWKPAATVTFRWASSKNAFGEGTNLQNITEDLREIFIADPGYILFNIDFEQVDARFVALDSFATTGIDNYLQACLAGDLHTGTAKMMWPKALPWTGDPKQDKKIAETPYYRHFSHRFMCKKLGHGSNYDLSGVKETHVPKSLATQAFLPLPEVIAFQKTYYGAFPELVDWKAATIEQLQTTGVLTNVHGMSRQFHGRAGDERTWREAISFKGQSGTAGLIDKALIRCHREVPEAQLLLQVHDSITGQIPEAAERELVPRLVECFKIPITVVHPIQGSRTHAVPVDVATGWNWGKRRDADGNIVNEDGLDKWSPEGERRQRYYDPAVSILDRRLR